MNGFIRASLAIWIAIAAALVVAFNLWPGLARAPVFPLLLAGALTIGIFVRVILRNRNPKP